MANYNNVVLVGRLTRDPETKVFNSGAKQAKFGFVVNNRKRGAGGAWEDDPMFIDVEAWNRGQSGTTADFVEAHLVKGTQVLVAGRLLLDQWEDKTTGQKRSKHKIAADTVQLLDKREGDPAASKPKEEKGELFAGDNEAQPAVGEEIPF